MVGPAGGEKKNNLPSRRKTRSLYCERSPETADGRKGEGGANDPKNSFLKEKGRGLDGLA